MADFTNDPRLKPCPLCKGHAHIGEVVRSYLPSAYFAACDDPGCRLFELPGTAHYRDTVDEAVEAWNAMPRWSERDELIRDLYAAAFDEDESAPFFEEACRLCRGEHGGKSPCASTSRDLSNECCIPYTVMLFKQRAEKMGVEL